MARLFYDHLQNEQPKFPVIKGSAAVTVPTAVVRVMSVLVTFHFRELYLDISELKLQF